MPCVCAPYIIIKKQRSLTYWFTHYLVISGQFSGVRVDFLKTEI
jgi:hypothetical protein